MSRPRYDNPLIYTLDGAGEATQCPSVECSWVKFSAHPDNTGSAAIGTGDSVSLTSDGIVLLAGAETPWYPVGNVDKFWYMTENVTGECIIVTVLK